MSMSVYRLLSHASIHHTNQCSVTNMNMQCRTWVMHIVQRWITITGGTWRTSTETIQGKVARNKGGIRGLTIADPIIPDWINIIKHPELLLDKG